MAAPAGRGWPPALPCAALFISPAAGARRGIPSPTLSAGRESPLRRRVTCPLPDPFRPGRRPSSPGAPRVPARSAGRPGGRVPRSGTRGATHPPPRGLAPTLLVPFCPPPLFSARLHPASPLRRPLTLLSTGTVGMWGARVGTWTGSLSCAISRAAFSFLPGNSGLSTFTLGRRQ